MLKIKDLRSTHQKFWIYTIVIITSITLIGLSSCEKIQFDTSPSTQLAFSRDTITFDTVFTSIGSATRSVKVFNDSDDWISISSISLSNPTLQNFRINVDGISARSFTDVEIPPNDSIWVFAEVTVDPDQPLSDSPFVLSESILFNTNGNEQTVLLEAWGQNANYIPNNTNAGAFALLTCDLQTVTWDDPKPYVIYGILIVDSCELVLPAGTEVFVHGGLVNSPTLGTFNDGQMLFLQDGSIRSEGTEEDPVIIQGDRLESEFEDVEGQWTGIRLLDGSTNNFFSHTTIKNSILGVFADSATTVTLENAQIFNTAGAGILASHASVTATNCLFYNNYSGGVQIGYGGQYRFDHCTIANYGIQASAVSMNNVLCLDQFCQETRTNALDITWNNCIIAGSSPDEIEMFDITNGGDLSSFRYQFNDCVIRIDELDDDAPFDNFDDFCIGCIEMELSDSLFVNVDIDDYHLSELSIAENQGTPIPEVTSDLEGNTRDLNNPDIGCYERQ